MLGVVRYWVADRRFGKIAAADRHLWFFHADDLATPIDVEVGMWVEFDPLAGNRGLRALHVRLYGVGAPTRSSP